MKSFFKYLLATVTGIILSTIILFFIVIGLFGIIISNQDKPAEIKDNTILFLKLDQPIVDRKPLSPFDLKRLSKDPRIGLNEILENLEKAKNDENIKGVYIEPGYNVGGLATAEEIRNALLDFRKSGKFVVSYCNNIFSQSALYLASASDKVFLNPTGILMLNGLSLQTTHIKNTLDKLDIEPTIIKIGKYKGYGEMFEYNKMSKPNREQLERIAKTVWENVAEDLSEARNIPLDKLNKLVNNLEVSDAQQALENNLVDSLIYKGDVIDYLKSITNTEDKDDLRVTKLGQYNKVPAKKSYKGLAKDKIAIIYASGGIVDGEGDENNIGGEKYAREIRAARRDSSIKAIVLRVNSGGGSAMASEDILVEIKKTKGVKPIIVSMGNVAGSGGYYISCAADTILAGKNTITGSIGVIGTFFNTEGFFKKMGISFDVAKSHEFSDFMSGVRPISDKEKTILKHYISTTYDQFIKQVAKGRTMTTERVNEIGRGHVYGGADALDINLIDGIGGLKDAIEIAHRMAGLNEKYRIVELPKQPDPIEQLIKEVRDEAKAKTILKSLGLDMTTFNEIKDILQTQGAVARMPYLISF